ncbi:cation transporter [Pseudarthrobacter sulfonivorans]|uniref:cation diffusion facilitator family transporter n=1 Tax=Pseudarthrobacter sulfonivorans TaxID=121292 RepID=UPI00286089EF|nr:cation transporter [Pseudarthrobacter sulfonivorans]MDR6416978.1 Co/Zn/Cd efflux system component [Pseudarthrobacter sulfonivorans]
MTTAIQPAPSAVRRATLSRRIRLFAAATITYNLVEAVVALWAGKVADSSALIGFGLDSVIEVASAVALSWQFSAKDPERREHVTLRIIAVSFFALAVFVSVDSIRSLTGGGEAQHSTPGIVIAALSLAIMPVLSWLQRRAGRELGSRTAVADSKQTLLCTYLSAVLLIGLVLNSTLGWWWADAGAALVIAGIAVREGLNAWKGDICCTVPHVGPRHDGEADGCCDTPEPGTGPNRDGGPAESGVQADQSTDAEQSTASGCCKGCGSSPEPKVVSLSVPPRLG